MTKDNHAVLFQKAVFIIIIVTHVLLLLRDVSLGDDSGKESQPLQIDKLNQLEKVRGRIAEIKEKLVLYEMTDNGKNEVNPKDDFSRVQGYYNNLKELDAVYQRQLTALETGESLKKEELKEEEDLQDNQKIMFAGAPPYNLSEYDSLLDQLTMVEKEEETLLIKLRHEKKALEEDKTKLEISQKKVRDITEELGESDNSDNASISFILSQDLSNAKLEEELFQAFVDLKKMIIANVHIEQKIGELKKKTLKRQANWMRSNLAFDPYDLRAKIASLEERQVLLQGRIDKLKGEQAGIEDSWIEAEEEFQTAQGAGESELEKAQSHLDAREAWRKTYRQVLEQTENMLILQSQEKQLWQKRYELLNRELKHEELDKLQKDSFGNIKNIERLITVNENYQSDLHTEIASIQKKLEEDKLDPVVQQNVEIRLNALGKMAERTFEYLTLIKSTRRTELRFLEEISSSQNGTVLKGKIKDLGAQIVAMWEFELWVVDDRSVTVKKLVVALLILLVGMLLTKLITRLVIRRILIYARFDDSGRAAGEKIFYFLVLIVLIIYTLGLVNIPITVFTMFGGALAIGVGFGAQNLVNNFISGLILLFERPVKINDMIEVENNFGIIEKIGMRCTRVRTPGHVHILVPNSTLLEKNIVNWTLSDQKIRAQVEVGVAHGQPSGVSDLMLQAVYEHEKVLKSPEPIVLFDKIGSTSFTFIVFFWISMNSLYLLERRILESDIRFRIIELFHEAGIVVAYPQRDVHLDTTKPLEFKLVNSAS